MLDSQSARITARGWIRRSDAGIEKRRRKHHNVTDVDGNQVRAVIHMAGSQDCYAAPLELVEINKQGPRMRDVFADSG